MPLLRLPTHSSGPINRFAIDVAASFMRSTVQGTDRIGTAGSKGHPMTAGRDPDGNLVGLMEEKRQSR